MDWEVSDEFADDIGSHALNSWPKFGIVSPSSG